MPFESQHALEQSFFAIQYKDTISVLGSTPANNSYERIMSGISAAWRNVTARGSKENCEHF